jgi:alkyl hydroperoxide reductase subunit AhpC
MKDYNRDYQFVCPVKIYKQKTNRQCYQVHNAHMCCAKVNESHKTTEGWAKYLHKKALNI